MHIPTEQRSYPLSKGNPTIHKHRASGGVLVIHQIKYCFRYILRLADAFDWQILSIRGKEFLCFLTALSFVPRSIY